MVASSNANVGEHHLNWFWGGATMTLLVGGLNLIEIWVAVIAGSTVGSLGDPTVWLVIILSALLGFRGHRIWVVFALAFAATAYLVTVNWTWWQELGIRTDATQLSRVFWPRLILSAVAFGLGLVGRRLFRQAI